MSVMIYDTVNSAFKDIQAMQRYDPSANAWTDCTSAKVQENGVWVEKFIPKTYLYKDGKITSDAGNIYSTNYRISGNSNNAGTPTLTFEDKYFRIYDTRTNSNFVGLIFFDKIIDFSKYKKTVVQFDYFYNDNHFGNSIILGIVNSKSDQCTRLFPTENTDASITDGGNCYYNGVPEPLINSELTLDVTNFSSSGYLALEVGISNYYGSLEAKISKVWLE